MVTLEHYKEIVVRVLDDVFAPILPLDHAALCQRQRICRSPGRALELGSLRTKERVPEG